MADTKKRNQTLLTRQNVLESLKDLGGSTATQTSDFLKNTSEDFLRELLGISSHKVKRSGEISPGESLQISDVISGNEEKNQKAKKQAKFESTLLSEEVRTSKEKGSQLRVELQAIMQEIKRVAESTQNLAETARASMISAPVEPGIYHVNFFQNLLEFLQSFRKRIDLTATWMQGANKRAEKKNYWSQYRKKGTSFLLNPESYSQRSAG